MNSLTETTAMRKRSRWAFVTLLLISVSAYCCEWVCIYLVSKNVWWSAARPVSGAQGTPGSFSLMSTLLLLPCVCLSGLRCMCPANHASLPHHPACQGRASGGWQTYSRSRPQGPSKDSHWTPLKHSTITADASAIRRQTENVGGVY